MSAEHDVEHGRPRRTVVSRTFCALAHRLALAPPYAPQQRRRARGIALRRGQRHAAAIELTVEQRSPEPDVVRNRHDFSGFAMAGAARKPRFADVTDVELTRRDLLVYSTRAATAGWLALRLPWIAALASCARDDASKGAAFVALTPAEASTMRAFAAQIIPSDDGTPGAEEAGAVHFVDRAFGMPYFAQTVPIIRAGLADLDARARTAERQDFASLPAARQVDIMRQIEREPFFAAARMLVVIGTLADPSYGGNKNRVGWAMIRMEHQPTYAAPYGWYDAQAGNASAKRVT